MEDNGPQNGGRARAKRLAPERRTEIAKQGAMARWSIPKATHEGTLEIGLLPLTVAVLEDGTRLLSSRSFLTALGRPWKGTYKRTERPNFIDANNLSPFVSKALLDVLEPVEYQNLRRQKAVGYRAELLPLVCDVYLATRAAGKLHPRQEDAAKQAEVLIRSLSKLGIIALVDEATGYQKIRARNELQQILAGYIAAELLPWAKRFPDSFYEQLHRVRGWKYAPGSNARNAYIGKLTNTLIYNQLPHGVLEDLRSKNPRDRVTKRRKHTHHEYLTTDVGHPHLDKQIIAVTTLLSVSDDWSEFARLFTRKFPPGPDDLFAPAPD